MTDSVKISALELENVKRIRALQLEPTAEGLTVIGGRNAQGKTSVIDAIAWALGGDRLRPDAPNRDGGATPAKLHVELSNGITVERRGKNGTLYVTDERGMKAGQQLLNEFVGQIAIDLPRFLNASDKQRADWLLQVIGVGDELTRLDREIGATFEDRRATRQFAKRAKDAAEAMESFEDVPDEEVDVHALMDALEEATNTNAANATARANAENQRERVDELQRRLEETERELREATDKLSAMTADADGLRDIDTIGIRNELAAAEDTNAKVRANKAREKTIGEAERLGAEADALDKRLEELRAQRTGLLESAGLPLEGLAVEEGKLLYKGHEWDDMSSSERLRVAAAIARATKPECGFVLIDELEKFDTEQLADFARWCEAEGLQVIGTRVATDDSCTVIIEDGRIVGQDLDEPAAPDPKGEALDWDGKPAKKRVEKPEAPKEADEPQAPAWGGASF